MAFTDHDIVIFSYADWHASWTTPQQIASRLAPHNRVLFVDQPRSFLYGLKKRDPQGAGQWSGPMLQEKAKNFWVLHMPHTFFPVGNNLPLWIAQPGLNWNSRRIGGHVHRAMVELNFQDAVLWNFSPLHGYAGNYIPRALALYDICDVWVNYIPHAPGRALITQMEEYLCHEADLVLPSTDNMKKHWQHLNDEMHVVPHAADYDHFAKAALPETFIPDELADLPRPIIGSVGVIDPDRFDVDLICHLSQARPDWSIVLVGPPRADMDCTRLKSCTNVYLTGNKEIAELPNYIKGMDLCLIPYKINDATRDIYPLKLQEYLASGKPVVSSAMPSVLPFEAVVPIARSHEEFVDKIEAALAEEDDQRQAARMAVARENSWEHRVAEKSTHIARVLEEKEKSQHERKRVRWQ